MHIEINGDTERLIQAGLASGEFTTADEALAAMARAWARAKTEQPDAIPRLDLLTDINGLIANQGIRPFEPTADRPDFWPQDESADEFLAFLRESRHDESTSRNRP
jgi:hypothetical protein